MITYFIKSGLCLMIILGIYHLCLEREKMHYFNRFFLLFGLAFAFAAPLVTVGVTYQSVETQLLVTYTEASVAETFPSTEMIFTGIYLLGFSVFLLRFLLGLFFLFRKINDSEHYQIEGATLVLDHQNVLPYTFWNYIFINKNAYQTQNIENELLTHELTHARQRHSFDILLVECLQILFWFNPVLFFYKKAIQLNHEFLADDQVIQSHRKVRAYQHLLLDKITIHQTTYLVSNLNFSITKTRLKMMTKKTSRWRSMLFASATVPLFVCLLLLFGNQVIAQTPKTAKAGKVLKFDKDAYFKDVTFVRENAQGKKIYKKYADLTAKEKASIPPPPPLPPAPNSEQKVELKP